MVLVTWMVLLVVKVCRARIGEGALFEIGGVVVCVFVVEEAIVFLRFVFLNLDVFGDAVISGVVGLLLFPEIGGGGERLCFLLCFDLVLFFLDLLGVVGVVGVAEREVARLVVVVGVVGLIVVVVGVVAGMSVSVSSPISSKERSSSLSLLLLLLLLVLLLVLLLSSEFRFSKGSSNLTGMVSPPFPFSFLSPPFTPSNTGISVLVSMMLVILSQLGLFSLLW